MKKLIWTIIVVVIVLLAWWGITSKPASDETVKIGVLTPLSGPIAIAGEVQKNSISLIMEDLAAQGISLDKYELVYEDSKYDPKTALSGYEALKFKGVKIIIADGSPVVAAIREKAVQDGILVFAQSATTPAFTDDSPLTCRIGVTADILGPSMSDLTLNKLGYKNIALMVQNNEYGQVMKEAITKSFKGKIVVTEVFNTTSTDFRTNISKFAPLKKDIDALLVINNISPEQMFKQLKELGWDKPIVSDIWTITSPTMQNRAVANGVKFVDYEYSPQADLNTGELAQKYAAKYQEKFKGSPILLGALTYDSFDILINAIEKVGSDSAKLAKELVKVKGYQGITGTIDFDNSCQNINKKLVWRAVKVDGSFEAVVN